MDGCVLDLFHRWGYVFVFHIGLLSSNIYLNFHLSLLILLVQAIAVAEYIRKEDKNMLDKSTPPAIVAKAFAATVDITKSALLNRAPTSFVSGDLGALTAEFMEEIYNKLLDLYSSSLDSSTSSS
jgi:hypothetical protein